MINIRLPLLILVLVFLNHLSAQLSLPYYNNFDMLSDTLGWSHYALSGTDDWELGEPNGSDLNESVSPPNAWCTNRNGNFSANSIMCLETPSFDFSDTSKTYILGFGYKMRSATYHGGNIEYSVDGGATWTLLDGNSNEKYQWYNNSSNSSLNGQPTWSINNHFSNFIRPNHILNVLKGFSDVKFRFKFGGTSNPLDGWVIDNFSITENIPNLYLNEPLPISLTNTCPTFSVNTTLNHNALTPISVSITVDYYWSNDSMFDAGDTIIGTRSAGIGTMVPWNKTLDLPPNLSPGNYTIFCLVDADSVVQESNESDNITKVDLTVLPIYPIPHTQSLDDGNILWTSQGKKEWNLSPGSKLHLNGTHSGDLAWSIFDTDVFDKNYIQSPFLDLSTHDSTVISFWYKSQENLTGPYTSTVQAYKDCGSNREDIGNVFVMRDNQWDYFNAFFPPTMDTAKDVVVRVYNGNAYSDYNGKDVLIDDIYIGKAKPDISIERKNNDLFTTNDENSFQLNYYLNNSGLKACPSSQTTFFWSTDTILDINDIFLGSKVEASLTDTQKVWTNFTFTKPQLGNGVYYVFYRLDDLGGIDEMREYNNIGYFTIHQQDRVIPPYFNDFESSINGWRHEASFGTDDWVWGVPNGSILDSAFSGTKAWLTNPNGWVSTHSRMHLYSPVFDLTSMNNPILEFDMSLDDGNFVDVSGLNISYSIDNGANWHVLDTTNNSFSRWFNRTKYEPYGGIDVFQNPYLTENLFDFTEKTFISSVGYNGKDANTNYRYILDLDFLNGYSNVQFRFNMATYQGNDYSAIYASEGVLLDNFSIAESTIDLNVQENKILLLSSLAEQVKFFMHIENLGNFLSVPTNVTFYLSSDTIIDASDYHLGQTSVPEIKPDFRHYINAIFDITTNLDAFNYLVYEIDNLNLNQESDELNNSGHWPLNLDGVSNFPYLENFNQEVVNGWNHNVFSSAGVHLLNQYRVRNQLVPSERIYQYALQSGELFTEPISGAISNNGIPTYYIESPAFDFSGKDSIFLSFDFLSTGGAFDFGGNMEYSIDGGTNWILLNNQGASVNWYNVPINANAYYQEPCWGYDPGGYGVAFFRNAAFDLSFLQNNPSVVFRYKYRSNHYYYGPGSVQGFRLDNFFLDAHITGNVYDTLSINICPGDTFVFQNVNYYNPGLYEIVTGGTSNYDSITVLNLEHSTVYNQVVEVNLCYGETHEMPNGHLVSTDTSYIDSTQSGITLCDSIVQVNVTVDNQVFGTVQTSNSSSLSNSTIYLIEFDSLTGLLSIADSTLSNFSGEFGFSNLAIQQAYYIKAIPNVNLFSNEVPTYYSGALLFQDSDSVLCSTSIDFNTIQGVNPGGPGFIGGLIGNGAGKANEIGQPLSGLIVILVGLNGEVYGHTSSNSDGYFSFDDIPCGSYYILIDDGSTNNDLAPLVAIESPNCEVDSIPFILVNDLLTKVGLTSISDIRQDVLMELYPNPTSESFTLSIVNQNDYSIEIYNTIGQQMFGQHEMNVSPITISTRSWNSGVYLVLLKNRNGTVKKIKKIAIVH